MTSETYRPVRLDRMIDGIPRTLPSAMRAELPSLTDEVIAEIRREIPEYARSADSSYREALRAGVELSLKTFVDLVADPSAPRDMRDTMCRLLGELEAREGRSLDDLQAAYRIGCQVAWRRITKVALRAKLPASVMAALADAVFSYANQLALLSAEGYRAAQRSSGQAQRHCRTRLLRLILTQPPVSRQVIDGLAQQARWPMPEHVTMVALRATSDSHPEADEVARVEDNVLVDLDSPVPHLLVPGTATAARRSFLSSGLTGYRIAIGLTVPLALAADSLRWARQALDLSEQGIIEPGPVIACDDHLVELWLLSDKTLADQIVARQMSVLDQIPAHERAWLIDTFEPWLERRGTAGEIAAMLGLHVQTVRYRINRLKEIFGGRIDDPDSRLAFELTLRVMRLRREAEDALAGTGQRGRLSRADTA